MVSEYLNTKIFEIGGTSVNLGTAIVFGLIVLATLTIARPLEKLVERGLTKRAEADPGTVGVTRRLVYAPGTVVLLRRFDDSAVTFEVSVWIRDPWRAPRSLSKLNKEIWRAFREHDITIAFPQLDLHIDGELMEALAKNMRAA